MSPVIGAVLFGFAAGFMVGGSLLAWMGRDERERLKRRSEFWEEAAKRESGKVRKLLRALSDIQRARKP